MPIILHGVDGSPFVRKVLIALAEKSIPYEQNPIIPFGVSDEYKQKSPLGKIPCLEDGDLVLPDSSAILAYLERAHPKPPLYPSEAKDYGRALWYEEYSDTKLSESIGPIFFERYVKKHVMKQESDEEKVRQTIEALPQSFDYLEAQIGDGEYLVAGRFGVADLAVGSIFVNLLHGGERVDAARWPRLAAYVERVHGRPSFKAQIEKERGAR